MQQQTNTIAIIGAGAAGIFSAITCAETNPHAKVFVFEKSSKLLAKVKVSGGGRCNVTHACFDKNVLVQNYPRGARELKSPFSKYFTLDIIKWFETNGVKLKTEADGRMFPVTDDSQTIIECLLQKAHKLNIVIKTNYGISSVEKKENVFELTFQSGEKFNCDKLIIASGGHPELKSYDWISKLGINIIPPVPSLFTFNIPDSPFKGLKGTGFNSCKVKIIKTKLEETGPLLITHWGLSGPVVLKLSAWGAIALKEMNYDFTVTLNFLPDMNEEKQREYFLQLKSSSPTKKISNTKFETLTNRFWERLCNLSNIGDDLNWASINKQQLNALIQNTVNHQLHVKGKTTFKEEFVTAGGVDLKEVDMQTMQSKKIAGLYFAGEVLNVDGITGGFNFQNAWSTGWIAGRSAVAV
ncbi:MAG: NAD(P)/FAD-dependent oxidoreductase [Bacteroidia bacterium]